MTLKRKESIVGEVILLIIYLTAISQIYKMKERIEELQTERTKPKVLLVKNYELKQAYQEDSEDDAKKPAHRGRYNEQDYKEQMERDRLRKLYKDEMGTLIEEVPRNYMDCYYYAKWNKVLFLLLLLVQLMQAMGFNGLFDIPALCLMLVFFSFYAYRKSFPIFFAQFTIFFSYYIGVAVFIKICYAIVVNIPML